MKGTAVRFINMNKNLTTVNAFIWSPVSAFHANPDDCEKKYVEVSYLMSQICSPIILSSDSHLHQIHPFQSETTFPGH